MQRFVCIHGHFYQPPRENPWLDTIEAQDSAFPYHDWNERVSAECYAPNAASRILDHENFITQIVNNYERMSFNFGPTLLSWMERSAPEVYTAILEADRRSQIRFSGHGNAMAQVYNHVIMPLANERDKQTQVIWGIRDFLRRFGRRPEGMWLAETAVDTASLEVLAQLGILFTVLAPRQAARVRPIGGAWPEKTEQPVDTTQPYLVNLPSGRKISVFFYDGALAQEVAFGNLLGDGDRFASRLIESVLFAGDGVRLASIATDGETYGHHHRFGDMALAYALDRIESAGLAKLTNYGEYLEKFPPQFEAEIVEDSSWSCAHGIERWRNDCGCNTGSHSGWNQAWRAPLRKALDWLRDELATLYEAEAKGVLVDPWIARNDFIDVFFDRTVESREVFLRSHLATGTADASKALHLLEMQRQAVLMFASCAWFFDDLGGIETVQAMLHAGRAMQLANKVTETSLEPQFLELIAEGRSNRREDGNGADLYKRHAVPMRVELINVGSHYAASSIFHNYTDDDEIGPYRVKRIGFRSMESGHNKLALGGVEVTSSFTLDSSMFHFAALHLDDQNLAGGILEGADDAGIGLEQAMTWAFSRGDMTDVLRLIDSHFPGEHFSLRSLFRDEQRRIVQLLLAPVLSDAEAIYRRLYGDHESLVRFLASIDYRIPNRLRVAGEITLDLDLQRAVSLPEIDTGRVLGLLQQARMAGIKPDGQTMALRLKATMESMAQVFQENPGSDEAVKQLLGAVSLLPHLGFDVDLWQTQNRFYLTVKAIMRDHARYAGKSAEWQSGLETLGQALRVRVSA